MTDSLEESGSLTLVSTPIGNLGDMTARAVEVLKACDAILAEDTRHSRKLLDHYGISTRMIAYHDHNKERITPGLVERLRKGEKLALISDAGTPGVSDPGYYLARAAIDGDIPVTTAPGASALLAALVVSGFPTDAFVFEGFTPKKKGELVRKVESLGDERRTVVFYVSPHQLVKVLGVFAEVLPERPLCVARELTKIHEEVLRGNAAELLGHFEGRKVRGEIVLLVKGAGKRGS